MDLPSGFIILGGAVLGLTGVACWSWGLESGEREVRRGCLVGSTGYVGKGKGRL